MSNWFLVFAVLMVALGTPLSASADPKFRLIEALEFKRLAAIGGPPVLVKAGLFEQKLDHFAVPDQRRFKQRYWSGANLAKGAGSPVLIFICGEGSCSSGALQGPISAHARAVGGHLFALEHRYYGQSQPFSDLAAPNLKYLSTEQALADIVTFKRAMQKQMGLTGPWIAVGGSYAGNLAAYLRSQYPQDFLGALASSAPVEPDLDFTEYDRHVARLAGENCTRAVQTVLAAIENEIQTDAGFKSVRGAFAAETVSRPDDFLYLLSDIASASIQFSLRSEFCAAVETQGRAGYIAMKKKVDRLYGNFADYSAEAAENISLAKHSGPLGMRQWFYQSCTEYGYWQNADAQESARSRFINSSYHDELCQRLFDLPQAATVEPLYKKFYLPLLNLNVASNILFTNGTRDPWAHLSIHQDNKNNSNTKTESLMIQNAGHCNDLSSGGSPEVMQAKTRFQSLMKEWLISAR